MKRFEARTIGVIVGKDLVGDGLMKLPFLRALRAAYPAARITWITAEAPTALMHSLRDVTHGLLDEALEIAPVPKRFSDVLRPCAITQHFDLLLDTRGRFPSGLLSRHIPHTVFLSSTWRWFFSDRAPPLGERRVPHIMDRLMQFVELASGTRAHMDRDFPIAPALRDAALEILPDGVRAIGFSVGAGGKNKIWPLENFIRVAQEVQARGYTAAFLLGPDEVALKETIAAQVPGALFPLDDPRWEGRLSVARTVACAQRLRAAVANDSGTGHMLAVGGVPLVSLFGPTNPRKLSPRSAGGTEIVAPENGSRQMADIRIDQVTAALQKLTG